MMPTTVVITKKGQKTGSKTTFWLQSYFNSKKSRKIAKIIVALAKWTF